MSTDVRDDVLTRGQREAIANLFSDLPSEFPDRLKAAQTIKNEFHAALAAALQSSLNEHLVQLPQDSVEERRELATQLNACLHSLNLSIKDGLGRPAIMVVDRLSRERPDYSRFRIQSFDDRGRKVRTTTSNDLPLPLVLMPAPPRTEPLARGYKPRPSPHR